MESDKTKRISRRGLVKGAAGLTAAGAIIGIPALVFRPGAGGETGAVMDGDAAPAGAGPSADFGKPLVAYVRDSSKGEIIIMTGVDETVVVDHALVRRLIGAGKV